MKTFKLFFFSFLFIAIATAASAQTKTEKISVAGECGMCKTKIEKAAKNAGASYALWDVDAKVLTVKYNSRSSNTAKIEKAVAGVGYDTKNVKATDDSYDKLHSCCKYERTSSDEAKASCCTDEKCADCCKDGKCAKATEACCAGEKCEHKDDATHAEKTKGKSRGKKA